ncbi:uncharacterized protein LOC143661546 [Tamandua tetradactyla]|uniref:uncharacterized protein LOC143661546 n=1 Tax=Tamandua tetradactyla TaxID=48850 RepID=UPI004053CA0B
MQKPPRKLKTSPWTSDRESSLEGALSLLDQIGYLAQPPPPSTSRLPRIRASHPEGSACGALRAMKNLASFSSKAAIRKLTLGGQGAKEPTWLEDAACALAVFPVQRESFSLPCLDGTGIRTPRMDVSGRVSLYLLLGW